MCCGLSVPAEVLVASHKRQLLNLAFGHYMTWIPGLNKRSVARVPSCGEASSNTAHLILSDIRSLNFAGLLRKEEHLAKNDAINVLRVR